MIFHKINISRLMLGISIKYGSTSIVKHILFQYHDGDAAGMSKIASNEVTVKPKQ